MPVISNTSPLLNLAVIGRLELLNEQFSEVWIPPAVETELRLETDLPGTGSLRAAVLAGWLKTVPVNSPAPAINSNATLHSGELAALQLALQSGIRRVVLDDYDARAAARDNGLEVIGLLGVLLEARRRNRIPSLRAEIMRLRTEADFYVSVALEAELLVKVGE